MDDVRGDSVQPRPRIGVVEVIGQPAAKRRDESLRVQIVDGGSFGPPGKVAVHGLTMAAEDEAERRRVGERPTDAGGVVLRL
jgi:hypothetical protein